MDEIIGVIYKNAVDRLEYVKDKIEQQKEAVEEKKDDLEGEKKKLEIYLSQLNADLKDISDNLSEIEEKIEKKQAVIDETKRNLEETILEEEKQYDLMKKRIKVIYEKGDMTAFEAFFKAKSYADYLNKAEYVSKTEEYDQQMFASIVRMREEIQADEIQLNAEMDELQVLKEQAKAEQSKVSSLVSSTSGSIATTEGEISMAEIESAAYAAEVKQQEANLAALKKQLAEEQAMIAKAAKMAWRNVSELKYEGSDRDLLACLIQCEAENQPFEGQVAVGAVVINRIRSAAFPNTMVGVIYQNRQFSPVASGRLAARLAAGANEQCYKAADKAMSGTTPVGNCLYFRTVIPQINGQIIGNHVFY